MEIRRSEKAGIHITSIEGQDLPLEVIKVLSGVGYHLVGWFFIL